MPLSEAKGQNSKLAILALLVPMLLSACSGGPTPTTEPPAPTATLRPRPAADSNQQPEGGKALEENLLPVMEFAHEST